MNSDQFEKFIYTEMGSIREDIYSKFAHENDSADANTIIRIIQSAAAQGNVKATHWARYNYSGLQLCAFLENAVMFKEFYSKDPENRSPDSYI